MEKESVEFAAADSGYIELIADRVEELPESPGVYQIITPGQKVIYVGHAGDEGLRESLWELLDEQAFNGAAYFRYRSTADAAEAEALALEYVAELKPTYNLGYGRFRNDEVRLPKQGHSVRQSSPNP